MFYKILSHIQSIARNCNIHQKWAWVFKGCETLVYPVMGIYSVSLPFLKCFLHMIVLPPLTRPKKSRWVVIDAAFFLLCVFSVVFTQWTLYKQVTQAVV